MRDAGVLWKLLLVGRVEISRVGSQLGRRRVFRWLSRESFDDALVLGGGGISGDVLVEIFPARGTTTASTAKL